jgi:hypothetical protein
MEQIDVHEHTGYAHPPQKLTCHCRKKGFAERRTLTQSKLEQFTMLGVEEIQTDVSDATGTLHDTVEGDGEWVGSANSMDLRKSESCQN